MSVRACQVMGQDAGRACVGMGLLILSTTAIGCSSPDAATYALAVRGEIDQSAPIKADAALKVRATAARVSRLLTDVSGWPRWQSHIASVTAYGAAGPGTPFTWTVDGAKIHSRFALVSKRKVAWSGQAFGLSAAHVWTFEPADGGVVVHTQESMSGFPMSLFYHSADLQRSDELWLRALQKTAEGSGR